jgi:hypothetical protein
MEHAWSWDCTLQRSTGFLHTNKAAHSLETATQPFHVQKVTPHGNTTLVKLFLGTYSDEAIAMFDATLLDTCLHCHDNPSELALLAQHPEEILTHVIRRKRY